MPARGGRVGGGGSRGGRSGGGGFRAPRVSSGGGSSGSRGTRLSIGNRTPRVVSSAPSTNAPASDPIHHRPWMRNRLPGAWGGGGMSIGILIALIVFGVCGCAALAIALQAFGFGS